MRVSCRFCNKEYQVNQYHFHCYNCRVSFYVHGGRVNYDPGPPDRIVRQDYSFNLQNYFNGGSPSYATDINNLIMNCVDDVTEVWFHRKMKGENAIEVKHFTIPGTQPEITPLQAFQLAQRLYKLIIFS